jgi:hypothetical protein
MSKLIIFKNLNLDIFIQLYHEIGCCIKGCCLVLPSCRIVGVIMICIVLIQKQTAVALPVCTVA